MAPRIMPNFYEKTPRVTNEEGIPLQSILYDSSIPDEVIIEICLPYARGGFADDPPFLPGIVEVDAGEADPEISGSSSGLLSGSCRFEHGRFRSKVSFYADDNAYDLALYSLSKWIEQRPADELEHAEAERAAQFEKYFRSLKLDGWLELPGILSNRDGTREETTYRFKI